MPFTARIAVMVSFFLEKVGIKILMYKRYVDHINLLIDYLKGRYRYENGRTIKEREEEPELQKKMQEQLNRSKIKIKVVEKSGTKVQRMLQKNDPFGKKTCTWQEKCMVCSGNNLGGCKDNGVTYKINGEEDCSYEYTG